jgi:hypothetical protein
MERRTEPRTAGQPPDHLRQLLPAQHGLVEAGKALRRGQREMVLYRGVRESSAGDGTGKSQTELSAGRSGRI